MSLDDVHAAIARLGMAGVQIVNLHPTRLGDIWSDVALAAMRWRLQAAKPLRIAPWPPSGTPTIAVRTSPIAALPQRLEALRALEPDVVLVKPCGFSLERTPDEVALLAANLSSRNEW